VVFSLSLWCLGFPLRILLRVCQTCTMRFAASGKARASRAPENRGLGRGIFVVGTTEGALYSASQKPHRESQRSTIAVSLRDCLEASCMAVRRVEHRKLSKHKKAPPPKTIAGLFDVIGWCWPQRRKRYWHLSRRDESCQQPIPISRRASLHILRCLARYRLTRVGGGYSFVCNSFQSRKFGL